MKKHFALALLLAAAPFAATAGELSYTFVEGGYARTDIDDLGDGDGFAVNGSLALNDMFHVFGGYAMQQQEESGVEVDLDQFRLGLGYRYPTSDRTDIVVRAAYERAEFGASLDDVSADASAGGYSLEGGGRSMITENFEISVMGGYADAGDAEVEGFSVDLDEGEGEDEEFYGRVGAQLKFNPTWGLVGEGRFSENAQQLFVGVRASF